MAPLFPIPSPTFSPVSQYDTAPSSPTLFPDDPHDSATFLCDTASSFVPFDWEEKPGKPKSFSGDNHEEPVFHFSLDRFDSFDGGKFRPLIPPPKLRNGASKLPLSPATTSSRRSRSWMVAASDPFQAAIESARKSDDGRKTASFRQGRKATNPPTPRRVSLEKRDENLKGGAGYELTGGSGSAGRSNSRPGSGREPDGGYEVDRRSLTRHRKRMLSCFC